MSVKDNFKEPVAILPRPNVSKEKAIECYNEVKDFLEKNIINKDRWINGK